MPSLTYGSEGDRIVLEGEADQVPDQEPGDIIFVLKEAEHKVFRRGGADLVADIDVTLAEALCGFSRVVLKHLDGRGIQIRHPQRDPEVLKPGQVVKVAGEGMFLKKTDQKGDLYLVVNVQFPEHKWLAQHEVFSKLQELLPKPAQPIAVDEVDEVDYSPADLDDFGATDNQGGDAWEDDEDDEGGTEVNCPQQ